MKIVWCNPNSINRRSFVIVKTLAVEQPDEWRVFYRSSRGPGHLARYLSFWSTVTSSLGRHNPSANHRIPNQAGCDGKAVASPRIPTTPAHGLFEGRRRIDWVFVRGPLRASSGHVWQRQGVGPLPDLLHADWIGLVRSRNQFPSAAGEPRGSDLLNRRNERNLTRFCKFHPS